MLHVSRDMWVDAIVADDLALIRRWVICTFSNEDGRSMNLKIAPA